MAALSDREVLSRTQARVSDCVGFLSGTLARQREQALRYYRGDAFGNEVEGRSAVVSRDVAAFIDTVMPSLMRVFAGIEEVVRFEPSEPGDEQAAQQATDYCNWIWNQQNDGFTNFHHWFKDGLVAKLGVLKIWWDDTPQKTRERYFNLTEAELAALRADEDIELGEVTARQGVAPGPDGTPVPVVQYDAEVVTTNRAGRVVVETVPPEEFLFGRRARSDRDADVLAHRSHKTQSELIAAGYDRSMVERLFASDSGALLSERIARFEDVDDSPHRTAPPGDMASSVEVIEAYLRLDRDGDGIAEYLKVCYADSEMLDCEEVDDHPFACVTPNLIPHRLVGQSMADQLMDIQLIKSTVLRQVLDNQYLQNMPQMGVVENQANLDDVLTRRPGGLIRVKRPEAVFPIPTQPLGREPYALIEYLDTVAEQRTGATRYNQGLDADTLNKTATGINLIQNAAAQRVELIARVYAETGVKRAFRRILALVCRHQDRPRMIRLRNQWVEMDPRGWRTGMDMTVTVGLGTGNKDQVMAHMMSLLQVDERLIALQGGLGGPLLTPKNVYAKLRKLIEAAGLKSVEAYYTDPEAPPDPARPPPAPPAPPPPDPAVEAARAKAVVEIEAMRAKAAAEIEIKREAAMAEAEIARMRAAAEIELAAWKAENEALMRARMPAVAEGVPA